MSVEVRRATAEDVPAMATLEQELLRDDAVGDPYLVRELTRKDVEEQLRKVVGGDWGICLVATHGGQVVGYLSCGYKDSPRWRPVKATEIHALYLREAFRSRGIGGRLIAELVRWSELRGAEVVEVGAFASNTRALAFYERAGFRPTLVHLEMPVGPAAGSAPGTTAGQEDEPARRRLCHSSRVEDAAAFFDRRGVVEAYRRTEDVHQDVAGRFAAERLSPALDIGCGDGRLASLLAGNAVRWVGVDLTPAMLARAPFPKVEGDAARLPFRSDSFGSAAALYMLYRLPQPGRRSRRRTACSTPADSSRRPRPAATTPPSSPTSCLHTMGRPSIPSWRRSSSASASRILRSMRGTAPTSTCRTKRRSAATSPRTACRPTARRRSPAATPIACRSTSPSAARSSTDANPHAGSGEAVPM